MKSSSNPDEKDLPVQGVELRFCDILAEHLSAQLFPILNLCDRKIVLN